MDRLKTWLGVWYQLKRSSSRSLPRHTEPVAFIRRQIVAEIADKVQPAYLTSLQSQTVVLGAPGRPFQSQTGTLGAPKSPFQSQTVALVATLPIANGRFARCGAPSLRCALRLRTTSRADFLGRPLGGPILQRRMGFSASPLSPARRRRSGILSRHTFVGKGLPTYHYAVARSVRRASTPSRRRGVRNAG
jgi:hypothetical protein